MVNGYILIDTHTVIRLVMSEAFQRQRPMRSWEPTDPPCLFSSATDWSTRRRSATRHARTRGADCLAVAWLRGCPRRAKCHVGCDAEDVTAQPIKNRLPLHFCPTQADKTSPTAYGRASLAWAFFWASFSARQGLPIQYVPLLTFFRSPFLLYLFINALFSCT